MKSELKAIRRIKRELKKILGSAPILAKANGAGRVFELYVLLRIAKRLKDLGWQVTLLASDGNPIVAGGSFVQRGGAPSGILPASGGPLGPSTIKIENKTGDAWELWNGVQFRGRSSAFHELDIAVVPHDLAQKLRAASTVGYPFGRPTVAIECKDVGIAGVPDEMRAFIGRLYDLSILFGHLPHLSLASPGGDIYDSAAGSSSYGKAKMTFRQANSASLNVLARRTGFSSGALAMTQLFRIRPFSNVEEPSSDADSLIDVVSKWIDTNL